MGHYSFLWTTTEIVSHESSLDSNYPSLAIDISGDIHIVWHDETNFADSGYDSDIFYKRYTTTFPVSPDLAHINPNPSSTSVISLDWNDVTVAIKYYIYRETSYIWSVEGLTPIAFTSSSNYIDNINDEGLYYYVIVTDGYWFNSTPSNCEYIEYKVPHLWEFAIVSNLILATFIFLFVILRTRKKKSKPN